MSNNRKFQILIINEYTPGANKDRAIAFSNFLKNHHYYPHQLDSNQLFLTEAFDWRNLPHYHFFLLFFRFFQILKDRFHLHFSSLLFTTSFLLRGKIIANYIKKNPYDILIFQNPSDLFAIYLLPNFPILYDSPTIYFQEKNNWLVRYFEITVFRQVKYLSFHWHTYFKKIKHLNISPKNPIQLDWGCNPQDYTCTYSSHPKIIYLGILNESWVNPKLLIKLSSYFKIDVYSYQTPDPSIYPPGSINYCGYLSNLKILSNYQFGLITVTNDLLHGTGFSAKHLQYLNYGLPVLVPDWRRDTELSTSTISYTTLNFVSQIKKYSRSQLWHQQHQKVCSLAKKLLWSHNLQPLIKLIQSLDTTVSKSDHTHS